MFDTLIRNGLLVDGTGKAPFRGTLALRDAKIAAILPPDAAAEAAEVWDAGGLAVAPGFLDIHTHSDTIYRTLPTMNAKLVSGVTCEIVGNCGGSCVPVREDARQDALSGVRKPRFAWPAKKAGSQGNSEKIPNPIS